MFVELNICSCDKSAIIEKIVGKQQIVSIDLCGNRNHCVLEGNPLFHRKVRADVQLEQNTSWEFIIRSKLMLSCIKSQYKEQFKQEIKRLQTIVDEIFSRFPSAMEETPFEQSI